MSYELVLVHSHKAQTTLVSHDFVQLRFSIHLALVDSFKPNDLLAR